MFFKEICFKHNIFLTNKRLTISLSRIAYHIKFALSRGNHKKVLKSFFKKHLTSSKTYDTMLFTNNKFTLIIYKQS